MKGQAVLLALGLLAGCAEPGRRVISTPGAPAAIGPYSQAVEADEMLWLSGQIGLDPETGALVPGGIREQTRQVLANLRAVLVAAGLSPADVVQCTVYLADLDDFAAMNEEYARFFPTDPPARATVQVARLPRDARVEIAAVARISAPGR